jgi:hypothetical protein
MNYQWSNNETNIRRKIPDIHMKNSTTDNRSKNVVVSTTMRNVSSATHPTFNSTGREAPVEAWGVANQNSSGTNSSGN